ncbi:carbon-nitrogen hydrolase family protein [Marinigracilibium pacificum]|uniref:Carbon-nitrogen hydrolase family protein n=1 Tax=Marinigracilibium pacificum TaxID=2729599 RepID=A0A848IZ93_9BACT|nr:carbon-nitrogen hydrolase family protein [Marinigracilibium pacificum]NMM47319.1 carbon-nitrogen hydrolase family protein [Marinigracilibium pacificum]
MKLKIATSQFSISDDISKNKEIIISQMKEASKEACDVIHFPENALSGYPGIDFESFKNFDWELLRESTLEIMNMAEELNIWVILGSAHELSKTDKPHNSLYIINNKGQIQDRYDKMFCAGTDKLDEELAHFTPGDHFTTFKINGIQCGVLICHEYRYPELYRELKMKGVEVMFHSYYAGNLSTEKLDEIQKPIDKEYLKYNPGSTFPEITMPATMISYAANTYVYISASNTSAPQSCWPSFLVRPDGVITGKLEKNIDSILISEIDTSESFYDSTKYWRERAINGQYHSGEQINDARSADRTSL